VERVLHLAFQAGNLGATPSIRFDRLGRNRSGKALCVFEGSVADDLPSACASLGNYWSSVQSQTVVFQGGFMNENEIPRRCYINKLTPTELSIYECLGKVEELGADPLLTEVSELLSQARSKLADWVDRELLAT
jgi:hypothetical protein